MKPNFKDINIKDLKGGMITGTCLFLAYLIQTIGLTMTTPGKTTSLKTGRPLS